MALASRATTLTTKGTVRRAPRFVISRRSLGSLLTHVLLLGGGFLWIFPFLWTLAGSLKGADTFLDQGLSLIPLKLDGSNYPGAWNDAKFSQLFFNTAFVTVCTVVVTTLFTAMAGYVLARSQFPGRRLILGVVALTLFLPHGYTSILPTFDVIQHLGLLNTLWSIILVTAGGAMVVNTFLFFGYFKTISIDLEEAARIDGASFHRTFWQVIFPLSGPMIGTVVLFTFINAWNSYFIPLVFTLGRPELQTLPVGMTSFVGQHSVQWTYLCAGAVMTLLPIMLVFVVLQRFFVEGVAGAVKG